MLTYKSIRSFIVENSVILINNLGLCTDTGMHTKYNHHSRWDETTTTVVWVFMNSVTNIWSKKE